MATQTGVAKDETLWVSTFTGSTISDGATIPNELSNVGNLAVEGAQAGSAVADLRPRLFEW